MLKAVATVKKGAAVAGLAALLVACGSPAAPRATATARPPLAMPTPVYGPASPTQIRQWTNEVVRMSFEAERTNNEDLWAKVDVLVKRILTAIQISNFEYESLLALLEPCVEWAYGSIALEEAKAILQAETREDSIEYGARSDKNRVYKALNLYMSIACLGIPQEAFKEDGVIYE